MRAHLSLLSTLTPLLFITSPIEAQQDEGPRTSDIFGAVLHSSWDLFLTGGASSQGRFLLQQVGGGRQRAVTGSNGFTAGGGVGFDFLPRSGARLSYTFSASDLAFRTDDGNDTEDLDVDDGGMLHRHVASAEIIRYMFPARGSVTPYGSAGLLAAWWVLDNEPSIAVTSGNSTLFRWGALGSFGVQFQFSGHSAGRVELSSSTIRSPFTGKESFVVPGGTTIDEPTRVSQADIRFVAVYYFSKPTDARVPATARR
jgi:hypothetical protein